MDRHKLTSSATKKGLASQRHLRTLAINSGGPT